MKETRMDSFDMAIITLLVVAFVAVLSPSCSIRIESRPSQEAHQ